jgi:ligand-binding sensor protein
MAGINPQTEDLRIADVVDVAILQRIQDTFAKAMGVAAVTVDKFGSPVTRNSNFQPICQMIRSTRPGLARCKKCDAQGGLAAYFSDKPEAYVCSGGLMDVAAPITIEGKYIGCILCGQVILTEDRDEFVKDIVQRNLPLGLPKAQLLNAAHQIPAIPRDRLGAAVEMLMLTANHIIEIGMTNLTQTRLLKEAREKAALHTALQNAQLRALQSQINPHFLFNSLTLVGYTALEENAPRTEEIAYTLSDLLRYSLRNTATRVLLSEEFEMVERYLAIQKMRFGDRLNTKIEIDPSLIHVQVPCMILQPLVENAVVHSVEPLTRPVTVEVKAVKEDNRILLGVTDDGTGMAPEMVNALNNHFVPTRSGRQRISLGLQSIIRRLEGEYGAGFEIRVESELNKGTRIILWVPLEDGYNETPHHTAATNNRESAILEAITNCPFPTASPEIPVNCAVCSLDRTTCNAQCFASWPAQ